MANITSITIKKVEHYLRFKTILPNVTDIIKQLLAQKQPTKKQRSDSFIYYWHKHIHLSPLSRNKSQFLQHFNNYQNLCLLEFFYNAITIFTGKIQTNNTFCYIPYHPTYITNNFRCLNNHILIFMSKLRTFKIKYFSKLFIAASLLHSKSSTFKIKHVPWL